LIVEGTGSVEWTEAGTKTVRRFTGEERYVNYETYLFGEKDNSDSLEVPVGIHTYKFRCQLPPNAPYTVDGKFGNVRYKVDTKLDISWSLCDLHTKIPFTVARTEDLNIYPDLKVPREIEKEKKFCWPICKSSPLKIKIRLPKSGYAVGENIQIFIDYENLSNYSVVNTAISLIMKEKFVCSDPVTKDKVMKSAVVETFADGVKSNCEANIEHFLQIPQTLMTSNRHICEVYQISYELKITILTNGLTSSPVLKIPITIGSIAIRDIPSISINC
jgi:hypothetical protein